MITEQVVSKAGVTGWRGFIGSHLVNRLDHPVLFQGDMRTLACVRTFVSQCSRIYHVAGVNRASEGSLLANNLVSTGNLILATKGQRVNTEVVFLSSVQSFRNRNSEYGFTKFIEEEMVKTLERWCIFRVPNVYGPGGKPFYNSVVATWAYQLTHGLKVTIDNPDSTREFLFIEDLVEVLLKPRFGEYLYPIGESMTLGLVYEFLTTRLGEHTNLKKCLDYYKKEGNYVSSTPG